MRNVLKFLHTLAAIGYIGGLGSLAVLHAALPDPAELEPFAALRMAQGQIAQWILLPSMGLVLVSGLLAMAVTPTFQDRAWVWAKVATGILIFEGTLAYVQGPMEAAAERADLALRGELPGIELGLTLGPEWTSFWVMLAVGVVNVVLGIWRPRLLRRIVPEAATASGSATDLAPSGPRPATHSPLEPESP